MTYVDVTPIWFRFACSLIPAIGMVALQAYLTYRDSRNG